MSAKTATVLTKTQVEDALLLQKKQLSPEAKHIIRIMENCLSQAEIATTIPAVLQLHSMSDVRDNKLSRALQEHQILAGRLEKLESLKQDSDEEQEVEVGEKRKRERAQLDKDIKNSVRDVLRFFRTHPDTLFGLRAKLGVEVGESECMLRRGLKMFHNDMVEKLLTSLDKPVLAEQVFSASAQDLVVLLEGTATEQQKDPNILSEITQMKDSIKSLQNAMERLCVQEEEISCLKDKWDQPHTLSMNPASLLQQIDQLNIQFENVMAENRQAERIIKEKNEELELEIENLVQNFDNEIEEIQANLEVNERDYEKELEELQRLEKPFSILEVEYNEILERRRLAAGRREEVRELELKTKAAIFAQAWWRGYSTRMALKNKGENKKAKKGKGKKTK